MKKIKNSLPVWLLSFAGAFIGAAIPLCIARFGNFSGIGSVVLNALFFLMMFAGGYAGMRVAFKLLHIKIRNTPKRILALVLCAVLITGAGGGGQALFMLTRTLYTTGGEVDVVLLLDVSASMSSYGYVNTRNEAAEEFVNGLDESTYLQVATYDGDIVNSSDLLAMSDDADDDSNGVSNRDEVLDIINSAGVGGGTDYTVALSQAVETLTGSSARDDSVKLAILLTDGSDGTVNSDIVSEFNESGIVLFCVCIGGAELEDESESSQGESGSDDTGTADDDDDQLNTLIALALSSGGEYIPVDSSASKESGQEMLEAFENAFGQALEYAEAGFEGNIMALGTEFTVYQMLVMFITFAACAILFALGYYAKANGASLIVNLICALLAVILMIILQKPVLRLLIAAAFIGAAFVSLDLEEKVKEPRQETPGPGNKPPDNNGSGFMHV